MNLPKQESCLRWPVCKYSEEPTCPMECGHFVDAGIEQENAALSAELAEKEKDVERLKIDLDVANSMNRILNDPVKSPCGHSSRYAHTEDGGKHIYCYVCSAERAEKAEAELADLRERMKPVEEVYENYNHGKGLYCDMQVIFDLWQAIKAACEKKEKMDEI